MSDNELIDAVDYLKERGWSKADIIIEPAGEQKSDAKEIYNDVPIGDLRDMAVSSQVRILEEKGDVVSFFGHYNIGLSVTRPEDPIVVRPSNENRCTITFVRK